MGEKKLGISRDLIIHPGETISDILEERGITQVELALRTGVTPTFVSNVILGKKDISPKFAAKLEYALNVPKRFWLRLQAHYDAELMEFEERNCISDEEKKICGMLASVIKYLKKNKLLPSRIDLQSLILSLRKYFRISTLVTLSKPEVTGAFRCNSKLAVNPYVLGAWVLMCQISSETREINTRFDPDKIALLTADIKAIITRRTCDWQQKLTHLFGQYGIDFSIMPHFTGAPVQGYISKKTDGTYLMRLTIRGAFTDIFWFSMFHELGHIINGDISGHGKFIDTERDQDAQEDRADEFASNMLLETESYKNFLEKQDFSIGAIKSYAASQSVTPGIVIGRLQKEKLIPYNHFFNSHKEKFAGNQAVTD